MNRKRDWQAFARTCAANAFENHFSLRQGVCHNKANDVLVVYNNSPYKHYPRLRDQEMGLLREKLNQHGIEQLAIASHPVGGPEDGYSCAMVLDANRSQRRLVTRLVREAQAEAWEHRND